MIKRYVPIAGLLLLAGSAIAQSGSRHDYVLQVQDGTSEDRPAIVDAARGAGDVVFEENFANGLAGNNGVGSWSTSGANGNVWRRTTNAPNGAYAGPNPNSAKIQSTTVANGFMIFNGDSANCSWSGNTPTALPTFTDLEGSLESPALDLSTTPKVAVMFQQRLRYCCGNTPPHFLEVSIDGGASWPHVYAVSEGVLANTLTTTQNVTINISGALLGGASNVKFRFRHNVEAEVSHYHWQIDDVKVMELHNSEILLRDAYTSHTGTGEEYAKLPASQLYPTMTLGARVINEGGLDQPGTTMTVDVDGPVSFNTTVDIGNLAFLDTVQAEEPTELPALTTGLYTATFTVSSDSTDAVPTNNTATRTFEISETRYALDGLGTAFGAGTYQALGTRSFADPVLTDGMVVATYYEVREPLRIYGIEFALLNATSGQNPNGLSASVGGGLIEAMIMDSSNVNFDTPTDPPAPFISDFIDVTTANVSSGYVRVPLNSPGEDGVELPAGGYYVGGGLYSNNGANHIVIPDDVRVPQPFDASVFWYSTMAEPRWFSNGNALAIRLILQPLATGISEFGDNNGVSLYPNPTTGLFTVRSDRSSSFTVELFDMVGARVLQARSNSSSLVLDLSAQAKGVYMVRVNDGTSTSMQRVIVD